jgi:transcriptional regulator with XRE-family HTH domain
MREASATQTGLADLLGLSQSAISHWITGQKTPRNDRLEQLAAALSVRAAWLAFGDGDMRETDASAPAPPPAPAPKPRKRTAPRRSSAAPPPGPARATPGRRSTKAAA